LPAGDMFIVNAGFPGADTSIEGMFAQVLAD
jgi:hypothetical protein